MVVVLTIISVLLTVVLKSVSTQVSDAKVKRTFREMIFIAQAAVRFYQEQGSWPVDINDLKPDFLNTNVEKNPYQVSYELVIDQGVVKVLTEVPKGQIKNEICAPMVEVEEKAQTQKISITIRENLDATDWLAYEKKYTYKS
ncbi:MAG: type II secretion system protein [Candidatus Omnitrophica bacterium]|nr:type II secretion system protein [Candidatus Omnitrophota bacterium]